MASGEWQQTGESELTEEGGEERRGADPSAAVAQRWLPVAWVHRSLRRLPGVTAWDFASRSFRGEPWADAPGHCPDVGRVQALASSGGEGEPEVGAEGREGDHTSTCTSSLLVIAFFKYQAGDSVWTGFLGGEKEANRFRLAHSRPSTIAPLPGSLPSQPRWASHGGVRNRRWRRSRRGSRCEFQRR